MLTANPPCPTLRKWGQRRRVVTGIRATALLAERASQYLAIVSPSFTEQLRVLPHVPPPFRYSEQHSRHRAVCMGVSIRRRSTASSFRFWGSATSGRLGRVTVLPQLKVDRLCSVVDGTAEFDPKRTRCTSFTLNLDGSVSSGCLEIHGFALAAASRAAFTGARPVSRAQRSRRSLRERRGVNLDSRFTLISYPKRNRWLTAPAGNITRNYALATL